MKRNLLLCLINLLFFTFSSFAQEDVKSEDDLKEKASTLFVADNFIEAKPIYAQLLSLYPQDPDYNYKYGACLLATDADKTKPLKYLSFAISKGGVDPLAYYYLGRTHHLNYDFAKAVKFYSRFKTKAKQEDRTKYKVERQIEMCKNGNQLLSKLNEVQVIERQVIAEKDFYRIYDTESVNGKLISKPEDFQTKYDKKIGEKSIIFLPDNAKEAYFSSYGKKGENGKDIFKAIKLGDGSWSEPVSLGSSINTKYDEDFAFIHPDGRTLYFASKGHTSMGGYDIFKSTFDDATGQWVEPENLDFAFSSADDDVMFITDKAGVIAYFASNRSNELGKYTVYKVLVDRIPVQLSVISGKFIAESNPENKKAKITVIEKASNKTIGVYETDNRGNYKIEIAKNGGDYQFNIETTEDAPIHTGVVSIPEQPEFELLGQELRLVGTGEEQQLVIKNIFDGSVTANSPSSGPLVSSELLRMKANLDVNYELNNLDALVAENQSNDNEDRGTSTEENTFNSDLDESNNNSSTSDVNSVDDNSSSTTEEEEAVTTSNTSASALTERLDDLIVLSNERLEEKQQAVNTQYSKGLQQKNKANELFEEITSLEAREASSVEIEVKKKEAGIEALKSAYTTQVAQEIEKSIAQDLANLEKVENSRESIQNKIENDELAEAELQIKGVEETQQTYLSASDIIDSELSAIEESDQITTKQIGDYSSKRQSFAEEKEELELMISNLEADQEKASGNKKEEIQKNIDALQLDQSDLEYQKGVMEGDLRKAQFTKKTLNIERKELLAAQNRINSLSPNSVSSVVSEEEKNALIAKLKEYRDNDVLAYSPTNELYANEVSLESELVTEDFSTNVSSVTSDNETSTAPSSNTDGVIDYSNTQIVEINNVFESKITQSEMVLDRDLQIANQLKIYDDWSIALQEKQSQIEEEYNAEIDEAKRVDIKTELDDAANQIQEKKRINKALENELRDRASGVVKLETTPVDDISEINSKTIVDESFTNFKFDQSLSPTSTYSDTKYIEGKRALYEAGEIAKQGRLAEESAYNLPTTEERTEAFKKVNQYKKASEQKQLKAAKDFAEFNLQEFQDNRARINNANKFGDNINSGSLDLAILLAEEAEVYFANAAQVRSEINEEDRLSKKEVELQKAYDYEVLALKKQKEAMSKLSLVVSEVVNNSIQARSGNTLTSGNKQFVQVITDADVLAITSADEAKTKAEAKKAEILNLKTELSQQLEVANNLSEGVEKDSVMALTESLQEEIDQNTNAAAILYERENQIKSGFVGLDGTPPNPKQRVLAVRKAAIVSNQIAIDTIVVNDERKDLILSSQSYIDFSKNREELAQQLKIIESNHDLAIQLAEKNQQLRKEAIIEKNKSNLVDDEAEKERMTKSAQVIDQKVISNEKSIDSLNKVIKVKNFVVITLEKKDNELLSSLTEIEKIEYQSLARDIIPGELLTVAPVARTRSLASDSFTEELSSNETSQAIEPLQTIPAGENTISGGDNTDRTKPVSTPLQNKVEEDVVEAVSTPVKIEKIDVVPQQIKEAIFITLEKNESAYNTSKPIPTKKVLPSGVIYKVQVGAFRNPIPQDLFKGFAPLMAEKTGSGITRYTAGLFVSEGSAIKARNGIRQLGYPDAFVVAFLNGKRISIAQARGTSKNQTSNSNSIQPSTNKSSTSSNNNVNTNNTSSDQNVSRVTGGSKEALSTSFNKEDVQAVVNAKTVEGLYYTVQIGVFSAPVKKGTFEYDDMNVVELSNGLIRYNAGMFKNAIDAADLKNTIQIYVKDAFISAYYNGYRISLTEASKLKSR